MMMCEYPVITSTSDGEANLLPLRPSCTHALRQQWQALSLRLRFGVFHVKRRLRRKTI